MLLRTLTAAAIGLCILTGPVMADDVRKQTENQKAATPAAEPTEQTSTQQSTSTQPKDDDTELVVELEIPDNQQEKKPAAKPAKKQAAKPEPPKLAPMTPKEKAIAERAQRLTREALSFRGARYVWGGDGRTGFDCSGFTQFLYARRGIKLPHSAKQQFNMDKPVEKGDLREGDLVFFNTNGPLSHVGMYIGDGKFVHAANPRRGVTTDSLNSSYYSKRYAGARRYSD